jgi:hypothetical protein
MEYYNNFNLIEQSSSFTARHFSKNQNAIGPDHSQNEDISLSNQKENQNLLNITNFTTDNPIELRIDTNNKPESKKPEYFSFFSSLDLYRNRFAFISKICNHHSTYIKTKPT